MHELLRGTTMTYRAEVSGTAGTGWTHQRQGESTGQDSGDIGGIGSSWTQSRADTYK